MIPRLSRSPKRSPELLLAAILALVALALQVGPSSAGARRLAAGARREKRSALEHLMPRVQQQGVLRVLVRLNVSFQPEGRLRGFLATLLQRHRIRRAQQELAEHLTRDQGRILRTFRVLPFMVLEVDPAGLAELAADPLVSLIQQDEAVPPILMNSVPWIGADTAWGLGFSGVDQAIAILDTGVDADHEFLSGKVVSEACFSTTYAPLGSTSLCPGGSDAEEGLGAGASCDEAIFGCDHGTHVAGIAAGKGASFSGVARDADIVAVQVFSRFEGTTCTNYGLPTPCALTYTSDQIAALEWVYEQATSLDIASVNMSLGGDQSSTPCDTDSRKPAIDQLRSIGTATVIASGNSGLTEALAAPACISSAISVGSTTLSDAISEFSNVAWFLDLLAPGSSITSSIPNDQYAVFSGTSMAAPHVAGAWAVLKSKNPEADVDEVLAALAGTGALIDDARIGGTVQDLPRIEVDDAVLALSAPEPTATPSPTPTATSTPTEPPTATSTPVPTESPTPEPPATRTPVPPTATLTPTSTATPAPSSTPLPPPETREPTSTPTSTETPVPPSPTAELSATPLTPSPTPEATATPTPTATILSPTATPPSATPTPIPSATPIPSPTLQPSPTPLTPSPTLEPSATPTPTATIQSPTATPPPSATPTTTPSATPVSSATPLPGDLNLDGQVDVLDVQLTANVFLGTETDAGIQSRADVNSDGEVNVLDVQLTVNLYLAG